MTDHDDDPLEAAFLTALGEHAPGASAGQGLAAALDGALAAGRAAWPAVEVPPAAFARHLAACLRPEPDAASAVRELYAADLYLACACARRDPRAIAALEAHYLAEVDRALARVRVAPQAVEDLKSTLLEHLLYPHNESAPLLDSYSGRGALGAWLYLVAMRFGLSHLRKRHDPAVPGLDDLDVAVSGGDPELAYLKASFAAEFKTALSEAIEALAVRDRNLLRQSVIDGLTIDQLGTIYAVHRATAARWITDVRARLLDGVQRRLMARLRLSRDELQTVLDLARSQLDVSVRRLLRPQGAPPPAGHKRK